MFILLLCTLRASYCSKKHVGERL